MMLERQLEIDVANELSAALSSAPSLSATQIVCSRSGTKTETQSTSTVAVACGFRQNDSFSLTPITVNASIAIITRLETDVESETHDEIVETIANKLSYWHKYGVPMAEALSNEKFLAGELRMDGGSARTFDSMTNTWRDTLNFSIRGAEIYPDPTLSD